MVNGEVIKRDGKLAKVEWSPIARKLNEKASVIRARLSLAMLDER